MKESLLPTELRRAGYKSPGARKVARKKPPFIKAKNCPDIFAEDAEFMRLFRESKKLEGMKNRKRELQDVMNKLKSRGWWLEKQATAEGRHVG